jgi:putative transcriptional regulator
MNTVSLSAKRIKEARLELQLTQKQFAAKLGVDPITISRWERGATSPSDLFRVRLARLTGKHPDYYREEQAA